MKFICYNRVDVDSVLRYSATIGFDKPQVIEVKQKKDSVSLQQYKLLYLWYGIIQKHLYETTEQAYSTDELDEHFKRKFLPSRITEIGEDRIRVLCTKTKLNTKTMSEYLNKIDHYCVDSLDLILPHPIDIWAEAVMSN